MATNVTRQETGFRPGRHRLRVVKEVATIPHNGRRYKVALVVTEAEELYVAIRLYNHTGRFIKQFLMEPGVASLVGQELRAASYGLFDMGGLR